MTFADDPLPAKGYDSRLMRRLVTYLRPHAGAVTVAACSILLSSAAELAQPWITQQAIDHDIARGDVQGLARMVVVYLGLLLFGFVSEYGQTLVLQTTGQHVLHRLRTEVYAHLQTLELRYYDRNPVGRLMTRVTTDVDALNELFTSGVITVLGDLLALTGIMIAMLIMNWRLALVAFSVLPFILWIAHWFRTNVRESYTLSPGDS